jgi:hypothetical protein
LINVPDSAFIRSGCAVSFFGIICSFHSIVGVQIGVTPYRPRRRARWSCAFYDRLRRYFSKCKANHGDFSAESRRRGACKLSPSVPQMLDCQWF